MAGGRGLRLHPITEKTPKPLLKVGSRPLLEQIITRFRDQGFLDFILSVNYLADLIRDYFGNGDSLGVNISYVQEREPLGTGGALRIIPVECLTEHFVVSNADVLTDLNYNDLLKTHRRNGAEATVALALHQEQIRFGVADTDGQLLTRLREKPIENFMVNAGIYVISRNSLSKMPKGRFDMPDFLSRLCPVAVHPIEGAWHDVGTFESIVRASQEIA